MCNNFFTFKASFLTFTQKLNGTINWQPIPVHTVKEINDNVSVAINHLCFTLDFNMFAVFDLEAT